MKNMTIGRYLPLNSVLHKLDPRTKIISMITLMIGVFAGGDFMSLAIVGIFVAVLLKLAKLSI